MAGPKTGPTAARPLPERFWEKVYKGEGEACWEWLGTRTRGYGMVWTRPPGVRRGHMVLAHRVAWELANGAIPDGMDVLHRCDNPQCVRESHLFLGTHQDNMTDMVAKGRSHSQRLTHCKRGHEKSGANLIVKSDGYWECRVCARALARARYVRKVGG